MRLTRVHVEQPLRAGSEVVLPENAAAHLVRVLRLGVTLQQTAAPQEVAFEEGTSFQVEAYEVSGTGSMLMSLDAITPLGELRGNTDLRGLLRHGQQSEPLRASGAVQVVISPVEDGSAG